MKIRGESHNAHSWYAVERIAGAGVVVCALGVIAYVIWTLDRGFDITDEAYYLLLATHADSVKIFFPPGAQQWLTAGLWQITGSIVMFRAAGMVLLLASSALLAFGVFSICLRFGLLTDHPRSKAVVFAGSAVGAMLYASTINLSPCYNLLASVAAYASAGMVLLASNRSNVFHKYALFALAGCALGAMALCKPPAAVVTFALLALWGSIFERAVFDKIFGSVAMIFGAVTFVAVLLLINTTISEAWQALQQGMQFFDMVRGETTGARLTRYSIEFREYFLTTLKGFGIPIAAMIVYVTTRRPLFAHFGLAALVITLIFGSHNAGHLIFSMDNATSGSYLFGGFNRYSVQPVAIFAMLLMALIISIPIWTKSRSTLALFVGLILLPYCVALGTGNALFTQVIDTLAFFGVLITGLMFATHPHPGKTPASLIGLCFILTIALQIVTSSLRPYHLAFPLTEQSQITMVGNVGEVKVDADTNKFFTDLQVASKSCGIEPGTPFIGLYNMPGVALALQAIPVLTPWLGNRTQAEFVLERIRLEELPSAVIGLQTRGNGSLPPLPKQLAESLVGYRYCGMAITPYTQQKIQILQSQAKYP